VSGLEEKPGQEAYDYQLEYVNDYLSFHFSLFEYIGIR
jgi:hypothetical protein